MKSESNMRKTPKLSKQEQEREKLDHEELVRSIFRNAGFIEVPDVDDQIVFKGFQTNLDGIFLFQNIIVIAEYTCAKSDKVGEHIKPKAHCYDKFLDNQEEFIAYLETKFPSLKNLRDREFPPTNCKIIIVYCSRHGLDDKYKEQFFRLKYLDYPILKYFESLTASIKKSSRFELFSFLGLSYDEIGEPSISPGTATMSWDCQVLPEVNTKFPEGHKVVSLYIKAEDILSRCYVLRKHGWKDDTASYQRMISNRKIRLIREHLKEHKRVFLNNIIVTFPESTQIVDKEGKDIKSRNISKITEAKISIANGFNQIGLVDGQHRVFAYYEDDDEAGIKELRKQGTLLATGIVYPEGIEEDEKTRFESKLFLEINSTQTSAASDLKQTLGLILKPFDPESIGKAVLNGLNSKVPLTGCFATRFYEHDKIKTVSIVSYGLRPLVNFKKGKSRKGTTKDGLYNLWANERKFQLLEEKDVALLDQYINFCVDEIIKLISAAKQCSDSTRWTSDKNVPERILSPTAITGFIKCLGLMIKEGKTGSIDDYVKRLRDLDDFHFSRFKSSQYTKMGAELFERFFAN